MIFLIKIIVKADAIHTKPLIIQIINRKAAFLENSDQTLIFYCNFPHFIKSQQYPGVVNYLQTPYIVLAVVFNRAAESIQEKHQIFFEGCLSAENEISNPTPHLHAWIPILIYRLGSYPYPTLSQCIKNLSNSKPKCLRQPIKIGHKRDLQLRQPIKIEYNSAEKSPTALGYVGRP